MSGKTTTTGQKAVRSAGRKSFAGTPRGFEPRPAFVDYKDYQTLKKFVSQQGKLMPRKRTGLSAAGQKALARAVKRARFMGLLSYVPEM
ncbi:MAG: 30S ribosomal protein S18 [Fimbriiglobus sp.]